nr:unnamed protein product [Spirometra erinaceieuropaei]
MTSPYLRNILCPVVLDVSGNNAETEEEEDAERAHDESESSVKVRTQIMCPVKSSSDPSRPTTISLSVTIGGPPAPVPVYQSEVTNTAQQSAPFSIGYQSPEGGLDPGADDDAAGGGQSATRASSFALRSMSTPTYPEDNMHAENRTDGGTNKNVQTQSEGYGRGGIDESNFQAVSQTRRSVVPHRRQDRSASKTFLKIDEAEEAEEMKQGQSTGKSMYGGSRGRQSRYTRVYNELGENAHERSLKITPEARKVLKKVHDTLKQLFDKLLDALENLVPRNFRPCEEALALMENLHVQFDEFIQHLRYSPYEIELRNINNKIAMFIDELEVQPTFLLLRLVEFGFHIYEFGTWIREKLLPTSYALLIHTIQTRIYRLQTGRVIRQVYYVPFDFDPVIASYAKSRRLIKIEKFCHCRVILLPPTDPRCGYCPNNYRTIEVNFDEHYGHYLGFKSLLNQCATSKIYTARLAATIFKRLSGIEVEMSTSDMLLLERSQARIRYETMRADLVAGTGLAIAPAVDSV